MVARKPLQGCRERGVNSLETLRVTTTIQSKASCLLVFYITASFITPPPFQHSWSVWYLHTHWAMSSYCITRLTHRKVAVMVKVSKLSDLKNTSWAGQCTAWLHIICLILLPVNAPMVNCQDELSLHLLQEEAQSPGGSLWGIKLLPIGEPNRRACARGDCMPRWGSLAQTDAPRLPVVLELCFSPAVRAAHKYGSQETSKWGGHVLLSHHPYIIRRTACLWVCTNLVCILQERQPLGLWVHLFSRILKNKING